LLFILILATAAIAEEHYINLCADELSELEIEVSTAGPGTIKNYLELPGEVRPNDNKLAHIVPRYSGIVTDVLVNIGDNVSKGQTLAVLESDATLAPFNVKTLISGTVIDKHVTLGEAASRDRFIFVIADLSTVWIDLTVYQQDLTSIHTNQSVHVFVGHNLVQDDGVISYITPVVDQHSRTATARLTLPNSNNSWRPGMFVTAKVLIGESEVAIAAALSSIHNIDGHPHIFIKTDKGFLATEVTTGLQNDEMVEIISGLSAGDQYVSNGGFTLKAELQKEAFGDGHNH
ncbi:HlyD family efflux transporter periplasmic adaptor subunit, partial [bacterium]|nr:HlyD family efflux transporter periplasmic adaptor subunit [bacterium]